MKGLNEKWITKNVCVHGGRLWLQKIFPKEQQIMYTINYDRGENKTGSSDFHVGKNLTFILFHYKLGFPGRVIGLNGLALDWN